MFQRLSSLFFGDEVEEVEAELKGPNPCVTEADEEGWMLVNLPDSEDSDCMMQADSSGDTTQAPPPFPAAPSPSIPPAAAADQSDNQCALLARCTTECPAAAAPLTPPPHHPPHKRRRTNNKGRARLVLMSSHPSLAACPGASSSSSSPSSYSSGPGASAAFTPGAVVPRRVGVPPAPRRRLSSTPSSTPSVSPGSGRGGGSASGGSSRAGSGSERGCMDESWFVTPPPCFTAEGATAETSPMEDLLIEHPSMSVYVSPSLVPGGPLPSSSANHLSTVGEESLVGSMSGSMSRVMEPAALPAARGTMPTRVTRGAAAQAGSLAKVTQVARVQRGKARMERRHLGRNRMQRQNRTREQVPRRAAHARGTFLHQPSQRSVCH